MNLFHKTIERIVDFIAPSVLLKQFNSGVFEGEKNEILRSRDLRSKTKFFEVEQRLGTPVIVVTNEWSDPVIGFVTDATTLGAGEAPFPVVTDAVTDEPFVCFGHLVNFSESTLKALLSLNPYERWELVTDQHIERDPKEEVSLKTFDQTMESLINCGFMSKVYDVRTKPVL